MSKYLPVVALTLVTVFAAPAAAQQAPASSSDTTAAPPAARSAPRDTATIEIPADLQRSLDELAVTLDRLGRRVANDPELRASAVRVAQGFVGIAQLLVVQQTDALQEALRVAAERLAEVAPPVQR